MCGIVGYVGNRKAATIILEGLKRLEYRGYDSAGLAIAQDDGITLVRQVGRVEQLSKEAAKTRLSGTVGLGHTRWATHGGGHRGPTPIPTSAAMENSPSSTTGSSRITARSRPS